MIAGDNFSSVEEFKVLLEKEKRRARMYRKSIKGTTDGKLMISNEADGPVFYRVTTSRTGNSSRTAASGAACPSAAASGNTEHPSCTVLPSGSRYSRKRITGNRRLIYILAHRSFLEERLRRMDHNIALYEKIAANLLPEDADSIIAALPKGFEKLEFSRISDPSPESPAWPNPSRDPEIKPELVRLFVDDMTPEEWASAPYCENTINLQNKKHRSSRGVLCRSKGEVSLIDVADELRCRFRYDCVIVIDGLEISPDLIIIRPDGRLIFVEHHGWIDTGSGDAAFLRKLWTYSRAGIIQGRNLLVTFDKPDGSADAELIKRQLQNMLEV